MKNIQQRILKGVNILKEKYLLFTMICLGSSIMSVSFVPFVINSTITEQDINVALESFYKTSQTTLIFSAEEMILSLIMLFQLLVFFVTILIIAYVVKNTIDKKMFRIKKWRDWTFLSYTLGIALISVDFFQKIIFNSGNDIIVNLFLVASSCFIIVIISSVILPGELSEVKI